MQNLFESTDNFRHWKPICLNTHTRSQTCVHHVEMIMWNGISSSPLHHEELIFQALNNLNTYWKWAGCVQFNADKLYDTHQHHQELLMLNLIWPFWLLNLDYYYLKRAPSLLLDWAIRRYLAVKRRKKNRKSFFVEKIECERDNISNSSYEWLMLLMQSDLWLEFR